MGVRFPSAVSSGVLGSIGAAGTEVVLCTCGPISLSYDSGVILLMFLAEINPGTGVTQLQYRIRRGTTTAGAIVSPTATFWQVPAVATVPSTFSGAYFDTGLLIAGQQYSLTCAGIGATGASITNDAVLMAMQL